MTTISSLGTVEEPLGDGQYANAVADSHTDAATVGHTRNIAGELLGQNDFIELIVRPYTKKWIW